MAFIRNNGATKVRLTQSDGSTMDGLVQSWSMDYSTNQMQKGTVEFLVDNVTKPASTVSMPSSVLEDFKADGLSFAFEPVKAPAQPEGLSFSGYLHNDIANACSIAWDKEFYGKSTGNPQGISTKEQPTMHLFEYAVIYVPEDEDGEDIKDSALILIEPKHTLGATEEGVRRKALREYDDAAGTIDPDFVRVLIRPFGYR